jgi:hypothetical protein
MWPAERVARADEGGLMVSDHGQLDCDQQPEVELFAGVDWGGSFHQLCGLNAAGTPVLQQSISHGVAGLALVAGQLAGLCSSVAMAIEVLAEPEEGGAEGNVSTMICFYAVKEGPIPDVAYPVAKIVRCL